MKVVTIEHTAFWCNPNRPNKYGNITQDMGRLAEEDVNKLKELGVKVNFDTDNPQDSSDHKGFFVKPKSETPVPVRDMAGKPLPDNMLIGNESKLITAVGIKPWVHKDSGRSGVSLKWLGSKVKEYVAYDPDAAAKAQAEKLLDGVSGDGFEFGGEDSPKENGASTTDNDEFNQMFGDSTEQ